MIHVDRSQLRQVRYLLAQAIQGNHILFDAETLREVFGDSTESESLPSEEDLYSAEPHVERIILQPTLEEKRAYLDHLSPDVFRKVVRVYLYIVERGLYENPGARH